MGVLEQVLAAVDNAKRVAGRNMSDLVSSPALYAERMTDALRNSNAGVAPTAAQGQLTNRPLTMAERVDQVAGQVDFGGGLGVIKPKGGNWLSGAVENQLKGLRKAGQAEDDLAAQGFVTPTKAVDNFVDRQLTKYIKNDMGTLEDPVRRSVDAWQGEKAQKLAEAEARVQVLRQKQQAQAATRGVPEEMLTRTRQDVIRAEEARDLVAENTGLHHNAEVPEGLQSMVQGKRAGQGQAPMGVATTGPGQAWEARADLTLFPRQAVEFKLPSNLRKDPWLANVANDVPVYTTSADLPHNMGFEHLIDELRNSVAAGKITPEQLSKMPIDQAVRHVAGVNALRAVESNKARAMDMADMPVHKEYPESGMSWRQLKQVEEGQAGYDKLGKWLKDEGDAMGHCVGGYCDDVASGQSSIYSLRDAKGKPYVTIETRKPYVDSPTDWFYNNDMLSEEFYARSPIVSDTAPEAEKVAWRKSLEQSPEYQDYLQRSNSVGIEQIKGPKNQSPDPQYFPMIQDFIRSGKWSDIQDAGNTGLSRTEINQILKGQ
jgi:hypothetical protein